MLSINVLSVVNMIFKRQQPHITLSSFDAAVEEAKEKQVSHRHGPLLGTRQLRSLIIAPSGGGKTNLMLSLLLDKNGLFYENIYLYSKTLSQPKYTFLSRVLEPLQIGFYTFNDSKEFVPLEQVKPRSIIVIDDLMCENQELMKEYFTQGRHMNIDIFYLCQSYAHIDKHCIREQANLLILFKMDSLNLKHVYEDHILGEMTWNKFKTMCMKCWNVQKYSFFSFFKDEDEGRFRRGLDEYIYWETPEEPFSRVEDEEGRKGS